MNSDSHYILVVEGNRPISKSMADFLQDEGYEVKSVYSSEQAIRIIRFQIPKAILIDYNLPEKNGLETLQEISRLISGVPVIMIGCTARDALAQERKKGLALRFITKPFNVLSLVQLVMQAVPVTPYAKAM